MKHYILPLVLSTTKYLELYWKGELKRSEIKQHLINTGYIYNSGDFVILNVIEMTEEEFNQYIT